MEALARAPVALLPVATFLAVLLACDSYKLVRLRMLLALIGAGALAAFAAWLANRSAIPALALDLPRYSRYVAPLVEEMLKGAVVYALLRTQRIGFPVDAAICGFAVGAGFALAENLYYLSMLAQAEPAVWILRGFGTAIMHGGTSAIFAILALVMAERRGRADALACLPGLALAVAVHSLFNHFFGSPAWSALGVLVLMPALFLLVFRRSERAIEAWLGSGFDADTELLALIDSGRLSASPVGQWLEMLQRRFDGAVIADLLCYLRLHVELGLRAKGLLLLREEGMDLPLDPDTRAKLEELRWLERSVGPTAMRAIQPFRHLRRKDLWQFYMLGR